MKKHKTIKEMMDIRDEYFKMIKVKHRDYYNPMNLVTFRNDAGDIIAPKISKNIPCKDLYCTTCLFRDYSACARVLEFEDFIAKGENKMIKLDNIIFEETFEAIEKADESIKKMD